MRVTIDSVGWDAGHHVIVDGVSAVLEPGTLTAVVGPNGSGKTTLLHLVAGLRRPSRGAVRYGERSADAISTRERARLVAVLEQHPETTLDLSVRQVVELGRIPHIGRWPGARDAGRAVVGEAMARTDVEALADRSWLSLSGGERQRTQLARALAQQPELLLLDEPTNHLDLRHQLDLLSTVVGLGLTTVAVLHDLDLAAAFCPRMMVMSGGRLVAHGPTEEVLDGSLIDEVFGVRAQVTRSDRLRVAWSRPAGPLVGSPDKGALDPTCQPGSSGTKSGRVTARRFSPPAGPR